MEEGFDARNEPNDGTLRNAKRFVLRLAVGFWMGLSGSFLVVGLGCPRVTDRCLDLPLSAEAGTIFALLGAIALVFAVVAWWALAESTRDLLGGFFRGLVSAIGWVGFILIVSFADRMGSFLFVVAALLTLVALSVSAGIVAWRASKKHWRENPPTRI